MLRNYFKIALRQLRKQGFYSAIKIGGFALGIATCLLIALYIRFELSFDSQYPNGDRLYRVLMDYKEDNGNVGRGPAMAAPFAQVMKAEFPQVESTGRIMPYALFEGAGSNQVRAEGKTQDTYEEGFVYADQSMLDMFQLPMVYGNRATALTDPGSIVLTKRKADKYFPGQNPVGKVLYLNDDIQHPHRVGGVVRDPPANTHLQFDFWLSLAGHELWNGEQSTWMAQNYDTYVLLKPGADAEMIQKKLVDMFARLWLPQMTQAGIANPQSILKRVAFELQPVKKIALFSYDISDSFHHGDIRFVWLFGAVGIFILLLACVNFINLSTARSANRAKEVGLRKVVGSQRSGLVQQFLLESLVLSYVSFLLAVVLAWAMLPLFDKMTDTHIAFPWLEWWLSPVVILAATVVGVLAGLYPAVYLSRFKPVEVLKGTPGFARGSRGSGLRSALVVFQFTTSVILIIATLVVYRQMEYIMNRDLGYNKDQVMLIQGTGTLDKRQFSFKDELLKLPGIKAASVSDFLPVSGGKRNMNSFWKVGREKIDPRIGAQSWWVDQDYLTVMGMRLVRGRNFSASLAGDSDAVVINQKMAEKLGVKDPLGVEINTGGTYKMHVVGVVADFNYESVKDKIVPLVLHLGHWATVVAVKTDTRDMAGLIRQVGTVWKSFMPQQELRYTFLDESFARMYDDLQRTQHMFTSLTTLAIIIACLGLFALSAYMAEQRRKEIGIRKVLGATVGQLTGLLSRDFLRLVLISIFIASPIAYWGMHRWLQDYEYRIEIGAWIFVAAAGMVVVIALATISVQAVRAAVANPAGSLRSE
ncbi:MAG TPA: ABC transporter permease [Puia sp.]|nr:ABC transporter permease [Puia sp.]